MNEQCIETLWDSAILHIWLNRPDVKNALNPQMIADLYDCIIRMPDSGSPRAVVIGGRGSVFCSGADLSYMRQMAGFSYDENLADATQLAGLFAVLNRCPCPVICRVQRGAYGGALGIMACCDTVIASEDSSFAFPEVRLGIVAATIAPYVIAKIGVSQARDLLLSGERFSAQRALDIGLVHQVVAAERLDEAVEHKLAEYMSAGPQAARTTKQLLAQLSGPASEEMKQLTARLIAEVRASAEGQAGLAAALAKQQPPWQTATARDA